MDWQWLCICPKCVLFWKAFLEASLWLGVNSRSWWWTGRPGVLWFTGSQRVGHDWATELNWTELKLHYRRRQWQPTPVLLPGKSHGHRSLVGCSPWGREESDMTEWLHFHFSLSCIGEGNGNPLQCSCLENPRDGVAQSQTRLKQLSSSSSSKHILKLEFNNEYRKTTILFLY